MTGVLLDAILKKASAKTGMETSVYPYKSLTVDECAAYVGLPRIHVKRLIERGDLKTYDAGGEIRIRQIDADILKENKERETARLRWRL